MKAFKYTLTASLLAVFAIGISAQDNNTSSAGFVSRRTDRGSRQTEQQSGITQRMQGFYDSGDDGLSEGDVQYLRVIYRQIDLENDTNACLYFPEEPIEGQENLFRIIMRLMADNQLKAYEYLDGREVFTEQYQIKVKDMLDRFHVIYTEARGSSEKNPRFVIEEADVPSNEVLSYYVIEEWRFDNRYNRLKMNIQAICPVLHRAGDFGGDAIRYPMFWVKYSDLRPYLTTQGIFVDDSNNLPTYTYDDFFNLNMYTGDIYKTRNLRNRSMAQMYPDPDDRRRACDSIQASLDSFEQRLWTPTREELQARAEAAAQAEALAEGDSTAVQPQKQPARSTRSSSRRNNSRRENTQQQRPANNNSSSSSAPTRSVRRRR